MAKQYHFDLFKENLKYMFCVVFDEKSKTDLGFEIGQRQQKCSRKPSPQSLANLYAVFGKYISIYVNIAIFKKRHAIDTKT